MQPGSQVPAVWPNSKLRNDILLYIDFPFIEEKILTSIQSHWILESNYMSKDKAERETRFTTQHHFTKCGNKYVCQRKEE